MDPATPSCLEVLQYLDALTDAFNGPQDPHPKQSLLYPRRAIWRKARKHESEDLNDAILLYFLACSHLTLKPSKIPSFQRSLKEGLLTLMDEAPTSHELLYWQGTLQRCQEALAQDYSNPLQTVRSIHPQLWLRAALLADPSLPAPLPAWALTLQRHLQTSQENFQGGSESWTVADHYDSTWARRTILEELKKRGWYTGGELTDEEAKKADRAKEALLASRGSVKRAEPGAEQAEVPLGAPI